MIIFKRKGLKIKTCYIEKFKNGENAVVTFINQGDKIEKEKLDMIFEKFFRAEFFALILTFKILTIFLRLII